MEMNRGSDAGPGHVLVVADWTTDPKAVVAACLARHERAGGAFALLVPAWLHGLDWAGDPAASVPCAQRQLTTIGRLADAAGITFQSAGVGDADPVAAICDALNDWPAGEVVLFTRSRRVAISHPLDLAHRTRRAAGLPVSHLRLGSTARPPGETWLRRRAGHCALEQPHPA